MKKVYKIYFYSILFLCSNAYSLSEQDQLLKQRYMDEVNHVELHSSEPLFSPVSRQERRFSLIRDQDSFSSSSQGMPYSPVPKKLSIDNKSLRPKSKEDKNVAAYLERHDFAQNPTLTFEGYSSVLGNNVHLKNNFSSSPKVRCAFEKSGVLNSENIKELAGPIESIKKQHQYCGFDEEEMLGSIDSSISFCDCVRKKTQENKDGKGLYKKIKSPGKLYKLRNIYRQKLVEKVMPGLLEDIEEMTKASNDFLSTDELSHLLYEVNISEDIENEKARSLLEKARQTMHSCSGPGLANVMEDLFNTRGQTQAYCDENSAKILLDGFVKTMECKDPKNCIDYKKLKDSKLYREKKPYSTLSDFLIYKYSQSMVESENRGGSSIDNDSYSSSLMRAKAMTDYDLDGVPFVNVEMVNSKRRLPKKEQLKLLHSFMDKKKREIKSYESLTEKERELTDGLIEVLSKNSLYKNSKHFLSAKTSFTDDEKLAYLKNFSQTLKSDMEMRIKSFPKSQKYFNESSDPVERMEKIIINNYLNLGDEVAKDCAETKRKLKKLCTSISGAGMAFFSHPDYREKADEILLDSGLQNEVAKIAGGKIDGRSPRADQMYCHANYSSLSSDCIEEYNVKTQSQSSPIHCEYSGDWFLSNDYGLFSLRDHIGNTQSIGHDLIEKASRDDSSFSISDDFSTVMKVGPAEVYKSKGRKLKNTVRPQKKMKTRVIQGVAKNQSTNASLKVRVPKAETVESKRLAQIKVTSDEKKTESTKRRLFSDNFKTKPSSFSPTSLENSVSLPRDEPRQVSHKDRSSLVPESKKEDPYVTKLIDELRQARGRQDKLEDQLEKLSDLSEVKENQEHKEEIKEKEEQLKSLQTDIGELRKELETKKASPKIIKRPQSSPVLSGPNENSRSSFSSSSPSPPPVGVENSIVSKAQGRSRKITNNTVTKVTEKSENGQVENSGRSPASRSSDGPIVLNSIDSKKLLPRTVDLSSVASTLKEEKYILLDLGNPELAEKVVFKSDVKGEILFDESGEPIIKSREIVKLEDELLQEEPEQVEVPASQVGEVEESKSYRWGEVEKLLDLNTDDLPLR